MPFEHYATAQPIQDALSHGWVALSKLLQSETIRGSEACWTQEDVRKLSEVTTAVLMALNHHRLAVDIAARSVLHGDLGQLDTDRIGRLAEVWRNWRVDERYEGEAKAETGEAWDNMTDD